MVLLLKLSIKCESILPEGIAVIGFTGKVKVKVRWLADAKCGNEESNLDPDHCTTTSPFSYSTSRRHSDNLYDNLYDNLCDKTVTVSVFDLWFLHERHTWRVKFTCGVMQSPHFPSALSPVGDPRDA